MVESLPSGMQFVISEPTDKYMFACQYENTPIQIYWNVYKQKKENFQIKKKSNIFHISAQNIDCGYSLDSP